MAFADISDINVHLPADKLIVDDGMYPSIQLDAERIVRGYLAGVIGSTTLVSWLTPSATPELIRSITGRFAAAFYYRLRYSEDSIRDPEYAQVKYDEGMALLQGVIGGTLVLVDSDDTTVTSDLSTDDFWPNDSSDPPKFTMDMIL